MIQQSYSWEYTQIKLYFKKIPALLCSQQQYSQCPRHGSNLNVHQQVGEWIKKMSYKYTMKYYSATEKNKIMPLAAMWEQLVIIILSEVS